MPNGQNASVVTGGGFFSHSKFRYTGRTEREILSESLQSLRQQSSENSSPTKRKASSVPATPSSPQDLIDLRKFIYAYFKKMLFIFNFIFFPGYNSLPRSTLSEPLGHFTDQASMFAHENGIPLLETVSEENRRNHGESEHIDGYYRESYDPDMTDIDGLNITQATFIGDGIIPLQTTAINNDSNRSSGNGLHAKSSKKFSLLHTFIPSFIFVIMAMTVSAVFVLETDSEFFAPIRSWPEMNSLRYQYYQPLKDFIASKIEHIFWFV